MPSAIILGGGIAGLAAGVALARAGWAVSVAERAPAIAPLGAALSIWANATAALDRLGMLEGVRAHGAPIGRMRLADWDDRTILDRPVHGEALLVTRADLQSALAAALPAGALKLGREAVAVRLFADAAEVHFADGEQRRADLVVDAGGIRSVAGAGRAPSYRGYGGVVALSDPIDDGAGDVAAEYWGIGERFGVFTLLHGRRYWFHMRGQPEDAVMPSRDDLLAHAQGWPAPVARAIAATPPGALTRFAIHARSAPRRLGEGRVLRVGDAAHAMEPNLGQGACQALEDAAALGMLARDHAPAAILPAFERLRLARVAQIVRRSATARHGAHGWRWTQHLVRTAMRLAPDGVHDRTIAAVQTPPAWLR